MIRQFAVSFSILFVIALLGGCGSQMPPVENGTTTMVDGANVTTSAGEPTEDGVQTTSTGGASSAASSTTTNQTTVAKPSGSTGSTTVSTTTPTAAPTVHTLTPLASSSYYGLSELKRLSNSTALVDAYEKIVKAVQNCQTTITMDEKLTKAELLKVFNYYYADYPQHFWCDGSIRYAVSSRSNKVTQLQLSYTMTGDQLLQAQTKFKKAVVDFLGIAATGRNEYERELLLHNALAKHVTYQEGDNAHDAYGALVRGKAVCEGYARAFQYLLYQSGIQCLIAEGESVNPFTGLSEGHAWNVVRIDGQYYHVDPTWDDTNNMNTPVVYAYFNLTTAQIADDHTVNSENRYALPNCVATANNFHVKNGTRLTTYTVDSVARMLNKTGDTHIYCISGAEAFVDWFNTNHNAVLRQMGINHSYSFSMLYTGNEVVVRLTT